MKFGSVCSGIEAASVAWGPLGWEAAWFSEIEPFPSAVLAHHYPEVPNLGDMTAIANRILLGEVEAPDVLCGGTPCQAFSVAGLRQSLADERGNLTMKFVEIADAIDHVRGRSGRLSAVIFWENVPGVLSTADNAFGCFLAGLAGENGEIQPPGGKWANAGAVYGPARAVAWRAMDAQYFGVAQRRRRVFVVASARNDFDSATVLFEWYGLRRDTAPSREAGETVAPTIRAGAPNGGPGHGARSGDSRDELITPVIHALEVARCIATREGSLQDWESTTMVAHTLRGEGFDASEDGTGRGTPLVPVVVGAICRDSFAGGMGGRPEGAAAGHVLPVAFPANLSGTQHASFENLAPSMGAKNPTAVAFQGEINASTYEADASSLLRTLREKVGAEAVAEWGSRILDSLQSPEVLRTWLHGASIRLASSDFRSFVDDCPLPREEGVPSRSMREVWESGPDGRSSQGRGLVKQLAYELGEALQELPHARTFRSETMCRLRSTSEGARSVRKALSEVQEVGRSDGDKDQSAHTSMQVRRLTPTEAERLQGFPDGYTAIPWRKKPASECPDGPRYKALGNSWAVPNVRWIGQRIKWVLERTAAANDNGKAGRVAA